MNEPWAVPERYNAAAHLVDRHVAEGGAWIGFVPGFLRTVAGKTQGFKLRAG